uniref:Uncharacterized protein n=1 Tax=Opuntia streptacantha TaxID=393608 RepID=A0A7C9A5J6_OPUST
MGFFPQFRRNFFGQTPLLLLQSKFKGIKPARTTTTERQQQNQNQHCHFVQGRACTARIHSTKTSKNNRTAATTAQRKPIEEIDSSSRKNREENNNNRDPQHQENKSNSNL